MIEPKWLVLARAELGTKEIVGEKDNQKIVQYFRDAKHSEIGDDETYWCAAFVGAMLERSGVVSTRALNARSYLEWGAVVKLADAKPGDIVVFKRGNSGWEGHVAFFTKQKSGRIYHIGGNQTNEVNEASTSSDILLGVRRPKTPTASAVSKVSEAVVSAMVVVGAKRENITLVEYALWTGTSLTDKNQPAIRASRDACSDEVFRQIVSKNYWFPVSADKLPFEYGAFLLDTALEHGTQKTRVMMQRAVDVADDGIIGPKSIAAIKKKTAKEFISSMIAQRTVDFKKKSDWDVRFPEWNGRLLKLRDTLIGTQTLIVTSASLSGTLDKPVLAYPTNTTQVAQEPPTAAVVKSTEKKMSETTPIIATKPWSQSLTIWGTIVTFVSAVLPSVGALLGWDISASDVQTVGNSVTEIIQAVGGVIGTVMAIIGRVKATEPVKLF